MFVCLFERWDWYRGLPRFPPLPDGRVRICRDPQSREFPLHHYSAQVWELESNIILSSISLCALISTLFGLVLCCLEITTIASLVVSFQNCYINFRNLMLCTSCTTAVSNTLSSTMLLLMKGFLRSFNTLPFTVATRLYSQV